MKTTLCTLYNSLYLDKGLVLYDSLKACAQDFELYVLCMDEKCFDVLSEINESNLKPLHLKDIENEKMLEAKGNRPIAEYCWTCSSRLIQYIIDTFQSDYCTYIDADMFFYQDPQSLVDEMIEAGKSVMMVPHRFTKENEHLAPKVGTYCVEFNCFKNDAAGREVLNHWHNQCLECCSNLGDGIHWGDQKYMDEWLSIFPNSIHVCQSVGAGIAQWNISSYHHFSSEKKTVLYKDNTNASPVYFYHFATLTYRSRRLIDTSIICHKGLDYKTIDSFYRPYLLLIDEKKKIIFRKYGVDVLVKKHPSSNKKISYWHRLTSTPLGTYLRLLIPIIRNGHSYIVRI